MTDLGSRSVVVVGGGAAGISAGFWLHRAGYRVRLYEAGSTTGGRCVSVAQDGFRFDLGAGALPATYTETKAMIDALGLDGAIERRGAVVGTLRDGAVHGIDRRRPWGIVGARHLTGRDKLSLWKLGRDLARLFRSLNYTDLSTAARFDTETVAEWGRRNFSPRVVENFVAPLSRALFLVEPERTSVVDLLAAAKSLLVAGHLMTHAGGAGFFLDAAASELDVACSAEVVEVKDDGDGVAIRVRGQGGAELEDRAAACVVALPARATLDVYPDLDSAQRVFLESLEYSACIVVNLGVSRAPDERSSMVLIPRDIDDDLAVVGLGHNLGPGRAPRGKGVLTAFWMEGWSRHHWRDSDDELVAATVERINRLLPGWANGVEASAVSRWDPSLVVATPGTYRRLGEFTRRVDPTARIQLAGDYLSQSSVNASVAAGRQAADRLVHVLA
jgi:oxygen-dependent protoporphyrinogen oxidase